MANSKEPKSQACPRRTNPAGQTSRAATAEESPEGPQTDLEAEPLSLAEELVEEAELLGDDVDDRYEQIKQSGDTHIAELQRMSMGELIEE